MKNVKSGINVKYYHITSHSKIADVAIECKASWQVACWTLHLLSTIMAVVNKTLQGNNTLNVHMQFLLRLTNLFGCDLHWARSVTWWPQLSAPTVATGKACWHSSADTHPPVESISYRAEGNFVDESAPPAPSHRLQCCWHQWQLYC